MQTEITKSRLFFLIQAAAARAGNESKLAGMLDETRHHVSSWKSGKRTCPVEAQILMAAIAGRDVDQVMKEALLERNAGTPRGEKLAAVLGKGITAVGGVTALTLCGPDALAASLPDLLRCILC
jgi:hypothetical protein